MDAMNTGYEKPLYILPFDHRHSYITGVFHWRQPLTPEQVAEIVASKQVIYDGFTAAVADSAVRDRAGILVDEAFGAAILHDAAAQGYITCVSTEKSGQDEFDFEYGDDFARHIEGVNPTFAKVLARYNPGGDAPMNARQDRRSGTSRRPRDSRLHRPRPGVGRGRGGAVAHGRSRRPRLHWFCRRPDDVAGRRPLAEPAQLADSR
jgi:myo-inositol catabolism protein IolC